MVNNSEVLFFVFSIFRFFSRALFSPTDKFVNPLFQKQDFRLINY